MVDGFHRIASNTVRGGLASERNSSSASALNMLEVTIDFGFGAARLAELKPLGSLTGHCA